MKTEIKAAKINNAPLAAEILKSGGLVIFPTDTVYGIAAQAKNEPAVKKIFSLKIRDENKPLSIFMADKENIKGVANISEEDELLIKHISEKFWPGPLTMVLPKKNTISDIVTGGCDTVGIRIPADEVALEITKLAGGPLVVTSANISGEESATDFETVLSKFDGYVDLIMDGGNCGSGFPSTVAEIKNGKINVLREGEISLEEIKKINNKSR